MPRYKDAQELYETFSHFQSDCAANKDCPARSLSWPYPQGVLAYALKIGYYSDKFDGAWREYTHPHGEEGLEGTDRTTYPVVLVQQTGDLPPWGRPFAPPPHGELAELGYCLDVQVFANHPNDPPHHINYKDRAYLRHGDPSHLPWLGGDPKRNLLVIAPRRPGHFAILLWSPILRIEDRGIVG